MNENNTMLQVRTWVQVHAGTMSKLVSLAFLVFGILAIIGAIRNWDWLYKPDEAYHNNGTIGQISRYLGRTTARILGFAGGLILVIAGATWTYMAFSKK